MHNMKYDVAMLKNSCDLDMPKSRIDDTRMMAHVLDPARSTALKRLAAYYVDPLAGAAQTKLDEALGRRGGWSWETVPIDFAPYWQYAALDTVLTFKLDEVVRPMVMRDAPNAYDLERGVTWVAYDMERHGIHVDRSFTYEHMCRFLAYCDEVEKWCLETYGVKPGANADVVRVLQRHGIGFTKATAAGAVALDKEVLGGINHPLAQAVLARRQVQKVVSTYLENFLEECDADDNMHPSINTLGLKQDEGYRGGRGVRTGRMSTDHPSLQNLSRRTDHPSAGNVVRDCIAAREGHTLFMIDFDQIEARMFAHMCGDPGLIDAFQGGDFFVNVAREIFDDPTITKKDPRRQPTKNGIYAKYYGAGAEKFAATAGITVDAAHAFNFKFDQLYPASRQFMRTVSDVAKQRLESEGEAYVRSPLTNRKYSADERKEYVLVNYLIQGTAAEVLKFKLLELSAAGLGDYMVLPVHDEVIFDVPDDDLSEAIHTARGIMNDDQLFRVPLTASPAVGKRWGQKQDVVL
jgi:DNA polymerase-1